ncbi:MAG: hypothetical protein L0177_14675 [Chloroflexi bacterium]|nr:hypothetical protein [Chloroflexota bacterium]
MTSERISNLEEAIERIERVMEQGFERVNTAIESLRRDSRADIESLRRDSKGDLKWTIGVSVGLWATTMASVLSALFALFS